jgi:hypothetical protein
METIWLTKVFLSHLLTDFLLQPKKWIDHKKAHHFGSTYLYVHTIFTAGLTWVLIGWEYWLVAVVIFVTHTLIDGWKSKQADEPVYFLVDQLLHLLIILACWWFTFYSFSDLKQGWESIQQKTSIWVMLTAFVFLTWPTAFLIGQLTKKWRLTLTNSDALANAGKWIGIIERCIILVLVLQNQYEAIGLLIAAKGIIRFSESDRPEQKTEYLLIGTLVSISISIITGLAVIELSK